MLAGRVVEHFDLIEHVLPCSVARMVGPSPNPLPFQKLEEAFCYGVVMTISTTAHAGDLVMLTEERLPFLAGKLGTLSEWIMTFCFGLRRQTAANSACKAKSGS
jgi:hypothetical protein